MKKTMKIVAILLVAIIALSTTVSAKLSWDINSIQASNSSAAANSVKNMAGEILSVVQVVAMAVAVIMLIVLAIKYISAAPSDKAEIKKHAVVYVVGAVVLFAATGILEIIEQFAGNIGKGGAA